MGAITLALEAKDVCSYESCIPLLRWADYTGPLMSRSDGFIAGIVGNITSIPASLAGNILSLGNGLFSAAAKFVAFATGTSEDISASLGPAMNTFAAMLYNVLAGDMFIFGIAFTIAVTTGLYMAFRGQGTKVLVKKLTAVILGFALFFIMGTQSNLHPDTPAPGTPYWTVQTATNITSRIGSGIVNNITEDLEKMGTTLADPGAYDALSCQRYISSGNGLMGLAAEAAEQTGSEIPPTVKFLNTLWEETGLKLWSSIQFGAKTGYAPLVFCRPLEARAGVAGMRMAWITQRAAGGSETSLEGTYKNKPLNGAAPAFSPYSLIANAVNSDKPESSLDTTKSLDRYVTMWMSCKLVNEKSGWRFRVRHGFEFLNNVKGDDKKGIGSEDTPNFGWGGNKDDEEVCNAAFVGLNKAHTGANGDDFLFSYKEVQDVQKKQTQMEYTLDSSSECTANAEKKKHSGKGFFSKIGNWLAGAFQAAGCHQMVSDVAQNPAANYMKVPTRDAEQAIKAVGRIRALNSKFNLPEAYNQKNDSNADESNWRYVMDTQSSLDQTAIVKTKQAIDNMHGGYAYADLAVSLIFLFAGLVNFVIWGLIFSLAILFATAASFIFAGPGLMGGFLIYAFSPERGKKTLQNTGLQLLGMCATGTILAIFAGFTTILSLTLMSAINAIAGTSVLIYGVEAIVCPLGSIALLRYLCVKVWKVGDPLSWQGFAAIAGGKAVAGKFGQAAKGIAAGVTGGVAAIAAGGGIAAAARSVVNGAAGGSASGAAVRGMNSGFAEKLERRKLAALEGRGGRAATTPATNQAEKAVAEGENAPTEALDEEQAVTSKATAEESFSQNAKQKWEQGTLDIDVPEQPTKPQETKSKGQLRHEARLDKIKFGEKLSFKEKVSEIGYQSKEFVKRHPKGVALATALTVSALTGGVGGATFVGGTTLGLNKVAKTGTKIAQTTYRKASSVVKPTVDTAALAFLNSPLGELYRAKKSGQVVNEHKKTQQL